MRREVEAAGGQVREGDGKGRGYDNLVEEKGGMTG